MGSQTHEELARIHPQIRSRFPQLERDGLGNKRIHLNCGAGTLMVDTAIRAAADAFARLNSLPGDVTPAETATRDFHEEVRRIAADFLQAGDVREISFHMSSTAALFNLAFSLRGLVDSRMNVVVTDLDHMANISPWETVLGEQAGCAVRRCGIDDQGRLDPDELGRLCDEQTALVALPQASNALGTIAPLKELIAVVRRKSSRALVSVDAVHHALHGPLDVGDLDCDFLVFSGYKVFGPMIGVLWGRLRLLERLRPYRVETNKDIPPYRFEQGTLNNGTLAGLQAALEYLVWVGERLRAERTRQETDRRGLFRLAMTAIAAYDRRLSEAVLKGFKALAADKFRCYGIVDPERSGERDPTFAVEVTGLTAEDLKQRLWASGAMQVGAGNHYSAAVVRHLGRPSICRASFCHYHTLADVDVFLKALKDCAG